MLEMILLRFPFVVAWFLVVLGLLVIARSANQAKQLVGLFFVQSSIIIFFMALSVKDGGHPPILHHGSHHVDASTIMNPLPHVLMLTAIVVGVATQGVAFMLMRRIFRHYDTLNTEKMDAK